MSVALVAGATRGAGRGIAMGLGEAGATVYVTGRTTRERRSEYDRSETIEKTAELVTAAGGTGIAVAVDHLESSQVADLIARIDAEQGRLDVLVNDIWGGELLAQWDTPIWEHDLERGLRMLRLAIDTHLITSHHALELLLREPGPRGATAVAITPGWMRSEMMLEHYGETEEDWRDGCAVQPHFCISESPLFVGRAVAALAADPQRSRWNGASTSSGALAQEYAFTGVDGTRPDAWRYIVERREAGLPADDTGYR